MTRFDVTFRLSDGHEDTITVDDPQDIGGYVTGVFAGRRRRICKVDEMTGLVRSDMGAMARIADALDSVDAAVRDAKGEVPEEAWKALCALRGVVLGFRGDVLGLMEDLEDGP